MHPTVFHMEISIIIQILTHYDMVLLTLRYSTFLQHTEQELSQYVFTQLLENKEEQAGHVCS